MKKTNERGFSIIELLIVVAIVGIVASLAVPHLQKGLRAAENGNMVGTMRTISQTEVSFFSQNSRFARLSEVNNAFSDTLGTMSGNELDWGRFALTMTPADPTDAELKLAYTITATRNVASEGVVYIYEVTQTGEIRQILP